MSSASFAEWLANRPEGGSTGGASAPSAAEGNDKSFFGFFAESGTLPPPATTSTAPPPSAVDWASLASVSAAALRYGGAAVGQDFGGEKTAQTPPPQAEVEWTCGLSVTQRFQAFGLLLIGSLSLYFAAIFLFLPMVIFMPAKFATTFTFASIMWMAAFAVLRGPRATLRGLIGDPEKRIFSLAYVGSLALTLYSTMFTSSYFLPLIAIFLQVGAMLWYTSGSIPGGTAAMGALTNWCFGGILGRGGGGGGGVQGGIGGNIARNAFSTALGR